MADPTTGEIVTYIGMGVGAAVAAVLVRLGWKKAPIKDTDLAISGQASIIDTAPIKELLKNVDLLTLQLQKAVISVDSQNAYHAETAQALTRLAHIMEDYLRVQAERQERLDLEATIRQQLRQEMEAHGEEPATQPRTKRS